MSSWISVKDKNPNPLEDDTYLVVMPIKQVPHMTSTYLVDYINGIWQEEGITHWQPLPEPPGGADYLDLDIPL